MSDKIETGHHFGRREAAIAAGGVVTLASVLWIATHREPELPRRHSDDSKHEAAAAILLEHRLRDKRIPLNRLAANYLHLENPNTPKLMAALETTRHKISHLTGYLVAHRLIERSSVQGARGVNYYQPTAALHWADENPQTYVDLAVETERIRNVSGDQST